MKKTYSSLAEHYLVPAVLFLLNVCLAHLVYAFAASSYSAADKIIVTMAMILFCAALLFKGKTFLVTAIAGYSMAVLYLIIV